jgi:hypothetical protein
MLCAGNRQRIASICRDDPDGNTQGVINGEVSTSLINEEVSREK